MTDIEVYDLYWKTPNGKLNVIGMTYNDELLLDEIHEQLKNFKEGQELVIQTRTVKVLDVF